MTPEQVQYIRDRLADWASVLPLHQHVQIQNPSTGRVLWTADELAHSSRMLSTMVDACESVLGRPEGSPDRAWASTFLASLALVWVDEPDWPRSLVVVPHNVETCKYCQNPKVREAVLAEDQGNDGWLCSKCGWATVDLGTMHEQLWPTVNQHQDQAVDMVCPGCGAIGAFVDYPSEETGR